MRLTALSALILSLAGCFVFDNPFDTGTKAVISFQVAVTSASYGGVYVWNAEDAAFEALVGGLRYYLRMDPSGTWCLMTAPSETYVTALCFTPSPPFRALPVTNGLLWIPSSVITGVDVSVGGISPRLKPPDSTVTVGDTLQVSFVSTHPGGSAKYQWQGSTNAGNTNPAPLGTGSTYHVLSPTYRWIRVIVTPMDGDGNIIGPAVTSPPVHLS